MFRPHNFSTSIKTQEIPILWISQEAYSKMHFIVTLSDEEVGWLGSVRRIKNGFVLDDVYVVEQEVSCATTEMSPDGLAKVAQVLIETQGVDAANRIRFWGHSHPHGSTSPSGQDESQIKDFRKAVSDFFIRGIANKDGKLEITIYDFERGLIVADAEWSVFIPVLAGIEEEIKKELKEKVKPKIQKIGIEISDWHQRWGKSYFDSIDTEEDAKDDNKVAGKITKFRKRRASLMPETDIDRIIRKLNEERE